MKALSGNNQSLHERVVFSSFIFTGFQFSCGMFNKDTGGEIAFSKDLAESRSYIEAAQRRIHP